jgi:hypothetical protein
MDAPVMPFLHCQRGSPSAPCAGLQPRQLHANPGDARYVTFQVAEIAVPRQMFQEILMLIARLRGLGLHQHDRPTGSEGRRRRGAPSVQEGCELRRCKPERLAILAANGSVAIEFRCDGASMRRKITPDGPGIRGMSVQIDFTALDDSWVPIGKPYGAFRKPDSLILSW